MSFESLDSRGHRERFPGLALAWEALRAPAGTTAVLNAANEVAVAAFLERRIRFDQIHHGQRCNFGGGYSLQARIAGRSAGAGRAFARRPPTAPSPGWRT